MNQQHVEIVGGCGGVVAYDVLFVINTYYVNIVYWSWAGGWGWRVVVQETFAHSFLSFINTDPRFLYSKGQ